MQLTVWTYEGPPHVGAMRIATAMTGVHYVLHAPQGDTYADLLFTMIERRKERPPVTYTTFQARDLGGDTASLFQTAAREAYERFKPQALLVGASCTAELIQDDPGGLAAALHLPVPVVPLELPSYQKKENWGAAETFYQLVRAFAGRSAPGKEGRRPSCNLLGATALGFRHRDDVAEVTRLLDRLGVDVNVAAPMGASPADLARLGDADFNAVLYPEIAGPAAKWLERTFGQPATKTVPIGVGATRDFIREVAVLVGRNPPPRSGGGEPPQAVEGAAAASMPGLDLSSVPTPGVLAAPAPSTAHRAVPLPRDAGEDASGTIQANTIQANTIQANADAILAAEDSRLPWYARSVDSTYLTGKRVFVFGDATHALAAARVARDELGFTVVAIGTYSREYAREVRALAEGYGAEAIVTDDFLAVEAAIARLAPELVLGTQMERHIAKRLGIPCAVISAPVHVQDFPARTSPQMGFEGANVLFDTLVHPLMMGLEEHLLGMFRGDGEFGEGAPPSHLAGAHLPSPDPADAEPANGGAVIEAAALWSPDAERELGKIPFFVRGKARRNTEAYARERALPLISVETLYDAKAHFSR